MKKLCLYLLFSLIFVDARSQATTIEYLSGIDKDHTVEWDFYCTAGRKSRQWTKIAVPSVWEQQGFGTYNYGHDNVKSAEQGLYKFAFITKPSWSKKKVILVFDGSMTDTEVKINGRTAGPVHQGGYYTFKYDITNLLKKKGRNFLEVKVSKMSSDPSVNRAERDNSDFWLFGGIFRPAYLEVVPETFIERLAINATADGVFSADVFLLNGQGIDRIDAQVKTLNGQLVGAPVSVKRVNGSGRITLQGRIKDPLLWNSETPHLYNLVVSVKKVNKTVHLVNQKFGFRTIELREQDGLYINGARVILKGSNRHSFWPESGRTLSHAINLMDARLMKQMNMNAVRMSHYPPDPDFLNICDSIGLYVLDELTGWQAQYDTLPGRKLVKELVVRDVNHPSVIFWDNGNEGGWNRGLDNDYALYDPQNRKVLHPWEKFNGTDTKHYPDYNYIQKAVDTGKEVFFTTEFMHGLYDGGAGAALDDFWKLILKHPHGAGGFIWSFLDEAIIRTDKNGAYDTDGNHAPDGIVGPHREKEASFYTVKEIWSPVYIDPQPINSSFDGKITIENRYSFIRLSQCSFKWRLARLPSPEDNSLVPLIIKTGVPDPLELLPGQNGMMNLHLPQNWADYDALYLTAYDPGHEELFTWSWIVRTPALPDHLIKTELSSVTGVENGDELAVKCDNVIYYFNKSTGYIKQVVTPHINVPLSGGPFLAGAASALKSFSFKADGERYIVESRYQGDGNLHATWTFASGQPAKLEYDYSIPGDADYAGITFNFPENKITGMVWKGRGPYRVWKNRLRGQEYGVWQKTYNSSVTGETWQYPEFKGYYADIAWVTIQNNEYPFTIYIREKGVYLQMLHQDREKDPSKQNFVEPPFPTGNFGFMSAISPMGTKFQSASVMGPQSERNHINGQSVTGTLFFDFTDKKTFPDKK